MAYDNKYNIELFVHQGEILDKKDTFKRGGLWLGTGGTKTLISLLLSEGRTLVIVPKRQKTDKAFEGTIEKFKLVDKRDLVTVVSKEEFKKLYEQLCNNTHSDTNPLYTKYDTVIVDEAHFFFGVEPYTRYKKQKEVPRASQMFISLYNYIRDTKPERFYMCTATPKSNPMNVYAMTKLFNACGILPEGEDVLDFYAFRAWCYIKRRKGFREIYIERSEQEIEDYLIGLLKKYGFRGRLQDWFDVPDQIVKVVNIELTPDQKRRIKELQSTEADPMVLNAKVRCVENGIEYNVTELIEQGENGYDMVQHTKYYDSKKNDEIYALYQEFGKVLVFANYTAQIESIRKDMEERGVKNVLTMTGKTKKTDAVPERVESLDNCIFIVQSSISYGYEVPSISCVIFASKSNKFIDYEQGLGRVLRANAIKKNIYVHLVVPKGADENCHKAIMKGKNFQEKLYEKD